MESMNLHCEILLNYQEMQHEKSLDQPAYSIAGQATHQEKFEIW